MKPYADAGLKSMAKASGHHEDTLTSLSNFRRTHKFYWKHMKLLVIVMENYEKILQPFIQILKNLHLLHVMKNSEASVKMCLKMILCPSLSKGIQST